MPAWHHPEIPALFDWQTGPASAYRAALGCVTTPVKQATFGTLPHTDRRMHADDNDPASFSWSAQFGQRRLCLWDPGAPQGIDNLRTAIDRGIIRDGFAATTVSMDRQIPTWRPGGMDRRRPCDLQHPMFRRQMRSPHGRRPVGHPAPRFALVDDRSAARLQAMWRCRFCAHRAKLA